MQELINKIVEGIVNPALLLLGALAFLFFLYGLIEFIAGSESDEKRSTGKKHLVWGIIGMFIIASTYGIIGVIENFIVYLGS
ncbi:hypothetical protein ACFLZC_01920 [Patescibacteria group bacterium]